MATTETHDLPDTSDLQYEKSISSSGLTDTGLALIVSCYALKTLLAILAKNSYFKNHLINLFQALKQNNNNKSKQNKQKNNSCY